jgi:hypothetical protein
MDFFERTAQIFEIVTPIVLFIWFLVLRRQKFFEEFLGIYSGFMPFDQSDVRGPIEGGIILNVADISSSGYFRGEADFRRNYAITGDFVSDGIFSCYGKMSYGLSFRFRRNPLKAKENRTYFGKLYIVDRLDIDYKNQSIDSFLQAEYNILYLREMKVLEFNLVSKTDRIPFELPLSFSLYKAMGINFEPYNSVRDIIFQGWSRVDKSRRQGP